jgi:hypothetical protein
MPQPKHLTNIDAERLQDYLLGLLPEEEVERIDEESIADDDVAARLSAVEDDLVDAYVTETLDPSTRTRFETVYLMSPQRRDKVKFARRFLAAVDRMSTPGGAPVSAATTGPERVRPFPSKPEVIKSQERRARFNWAFATAAASMALACGLLVNDLQLRDGLNRALQLGAAKDQRVSSLARQLDQARNENVAITQALEQTRAASTPVERPASGGSSPSISPAALAGTRAVVLFLQTRSIEQVPVVNIPSNTDSVAFELRLESNEFPQYRARLKDPETNRILWQSAELHARSIAPISVTLVVPARLLESKHYSFELAGIDRAGHDTTTGTYAVEIDRR